MATKHSLSLVHPWIWAMEALASSSEVDASLLIDLTKMAPDMSGDAGGNAREGVSFKILESLLTNSLKTGKNVSSSSDTKIGFELSQRCEDILCLILNDSSGSKQKLSEIDVSKYDIEPFLTQKCAYPGKSSLRQIKELIQGNHPLLAHLKENSGLDRSDKFEIFNTDNETQEIPASKDFVDFSSGESDGHLQREIPDVKLPNDVTIGQPSVSPERTEKIEANDNVNQHEMPIFDEDSQDESEESSPKEPANNTFVPNTPSASGDKADLASSGENINDELTNIATKKRGFISSQCSELNLCIKCNKDGCLLVCSSPTCPITVHENCLPSAPTFSGGNFCCPFCSYSRAASEYMEMKEKALVARKDLMVFLATNVIDSGPQTKKTKHQKDGNEKYEGKSVGNASGDQNPNPSNRQLAIYVPRDGMEKENCDDKRSGPVNADKDESSEEESGASGFHVSFRHHEKLDTRWSSYLGRRKKLPWTKAEEEKLKEGVGRFSKANENMPWKIIMEFGCNVFHKGRTTIDLKDKWRNMQKSCK